MPPPAPSNRPSLQHTRAYTHRHTRTHARTLDRRMHSLTCKVRRRHLLSNSSYFVSYLSFLLPRRHHGAVEAVAAFVLTHAQTHAKAGFVFFCPLFVAGTNRMDELPRRLAVARCKSKKRNLYSFDCLYLGFDVSCSFIGPGDNSARCLI